MSHISPCSIPIPVYSLGWFTCARSQTLQKNAVNVFHRAIVALFVQRFVLCFMGLADVFYRRVRIPFEGYVPEITIALHGSQTRFYAGI